jgi:fumarate hydratase class II
MTETTEYRIEHDTMGEVRVPKDALYAAQTQRAVENFPISGTGLESTQIAALARIKKAAALANKDLGTLDGAIADAIAAAPTTSSPVATTPTSPSTRTRPGRAPRRT